MTFPFKNHAAQLLCVVLFGAGPSVATAQESSSTGELRDMLPPASYRVEQPPNGSPASETDLVDEKNESAAGPVVPPKLEVPLIPPPVVPPVSGPGSSRQFAVESSEPQLPDVVSPAATPSHVPAPNSASESDLAEKLHRVRSRTRQLKQQIRKPIPSGAIFADEPITPPIAGDPSLDAAVPDTQPAEDEGRDVPAPDPLDDFTVTPIADGPVDRAALADSLFAAGDVRLALQVYESLAADESSTVDRFWISYQTAGCLRRLGDAGSAQKLYRDLAGEPEAGLLADHARWWLDQMDERTSLESDLLRVQQVLKALQEQNDANASP